MQPNDELRRRSTWRESVLGERGEDIEPRRPLNATREDSAKIETSAVDGMDERRISVAPMMDRTDLVDIVFRNKRLWGFKPGSVLVAPMGRSPARRLP
jgi:hypothetical protein